jgi:hypothetical protein
VTATASLLASVSVERRAAAAHHVLPTLSPDERLAMLAVVLWPTRADQLAPLVGSAAEVPPQAPFGRCEYDPCGRPLPEPPRRDGKRRRYCSRSCAQAARSVVTRPPRACAGCGETFQPLQTTSRYCSERCYQRAYRRERKTAAAGV